MSWHPIHPLLKAELPPPALQPAFQARNKMTLPLQLCWIIFSMTLWSCFWDQGAHYPMEMQSKAKICRLPLRFWFHADWETWPAARKWRKCFLPLSLELHRQQIRSNWPQSSGPQSYCIYSPVRNEWAQAFNLCCGHWWGPSSSLAIRRTQQRRALQAAPQIWATWSPAQAGHSRDKV